MQLKKLEKLKLLPIRVLWWKGKCILFMTFSELLFTRCFCLSVIQTL